ncbi:GNAT family N-acetyltransferase [Diplocloster modestus]|uniref:GNAT family N-acetyltransferase n=1 Tax=Diplocloster modestus TaxID=2850322 RepID=A0ABS6K249_9FIRM|nr:GNAT family N-acetyltransferase [Diplocloster modestus]MBU9724702.1 GNAT family N-acetyltransferase [Diplocloster modestus]
MFAVRDMKLSDKEQVLSMVEEFYQSDAVDHAISKEIRERSFEAAAGTSPMIRGIVLVEEEQIVGYAYLTPFYTCEAGGVNLMIEELFLKDVCRGKGYGTKFFQWMFREYPDVVRFRLEVTAANEGAAALYKKLGFEYLDYRQMVLDRL